MNKFRATLLKISVCLLGTVLVVSSLSFLLDWQPNQEFLNNLSASVSNLAYDKCLNITGSQNIVPWNLTRDSNGNCYCTNGRGNPPTCTTGSADLCKNINGTQTTVPSNTTRDSNGNCNCKNGSTNPPTCTAVQTPHLTPDNDQCKNINGTQTTVPSNTTRDSNGNCNCNNGATNPPTCTGGNQTPSPTPTTDLCVNIPGTQTKVPSNTTRDSNGNCNCNNSATNPPTCTADLCANIPGIQTKVPSNTTRDSNGNCNCNNGATNPPTCDLHIGICGSSNGYVSKSYTDFPVGANTYCKSSFGYSGIKETETGWSWTCYGSPSNNSQNVKCSAKKQLAGICNDDADDTKVTAPTNPCLTSYGSKDFARLILNKPDGSFEYLWAWVCVGRIWGGTDTHCPTLNH